MDEKHFRDVFPSQISSAATYSLRFQLVCFLFIFMLLLFYFLAWVLVKT